MDVEFEIKRNKNIEKLEDVQKIEKTVLEIIENMIFNEECFLIKYPEKDNAYVNELIRREKDLITIFKNFPKWEKIREEYKIYLCSIIKNL